jgi:hypothetical protein
MPVGRTHRAGEGVEDGLGQGGLGEQLGDPEVDRSPGASVDSKDGVGTQDHRSLLEPHAESVSAPLDFDVTQGPSVAKVNHVSACHAG